MLYTFLSFTGSIQCKNNLFFGEDKLISSQVKSILYIYFLRVKNRTICQLWIPMFDFPAIVQRFVSEIEKMIFLLTCFIKSSRLNAYVKRPIIVFHLVTRKFTLLTQIDFQTLLRRLISEMRWKWLFPSNPALLKIGPWNPIVSISWVEIVSNFGDRSKIWNIQQTTRYKFKNKKRRLISYT